MTLCYNCLLITVSFCADKTNYRYELIKINSHLIPVSTPKEHLQHLHQEEVFATTLIVVLGFLTSMVQSEREVDEPLISDENVDDVSFGDIAREVSIMGWIGFGGELMDGS